MEFPKMLYRADQQFDDQEALKMAMQTGALKTMIVESADEQKAAMKKRWTDKLASFVKADVTLEIEAAPKTDTAPESEAQ